MTNQVEVCRVIKRDTLYGTFYLPQRYVYKSRWFGTSGYEWEYFTYEEYYVMGTLTKEFVRYYFNPQYTNSQWKDPTLAERVCRRYVEVEYEDKTIKTWSIDG